MSFKGIAEGRNIVNVDLNIFVKFFMEEIFHDSDQGSCRINVSLHHDFVSE